MMTSNSVFKTTVMCGLVLTMLAVTRAVGVAQTSNFKTTERLNLPQQESAAETGEDEKLDDSFRKFGSAAGAAYQCTPDADKEKLVSDVRRAYTRIGQLFGTDRAFIFAVHFGTASQGEFEKQKCAELIKKLRESVLIRRAAQ
jgi:hypothetical protein